MKFVGPVGRFGRATNFLPMLRDFVEHLKERVAAGEKVDKALLAVITDGDWHDVPEVAEYVEEMEKAIKKGKLPKIVVSVVGVGDGVNENMMEELLHNTEEKDAPDVAFCFNHLDELPHIAGIVAHLADAKMFAWDTGASIFDDKGNPIKEWETDVPVFIELELDVEVEHLVFKAQGKEWTITIDHDDDHGGEEHHEEEGHEEEDHH
jgi:hypothetical protein